MNYCVKQALLTSNRHPLHQTGTPCVKQAPLASNRHSWRQTGKQALLASNRISNHPVYHPGVKQELLASNRNSWRQTGTPCIKQALHASNRHSWRQTGTPGIKQVFLASNRHPLRQTAWTRLNYIFWNDSTMVIKCIKQKKILLEFVKESRGPCAAPQAFIAQQAFIAPKCGKHRDKETKNLRILLSTIRLWTTCSLWQLMLTSTYIYACGNGRNHDILMITLVSYR